MLERTSLTIAITSAPSFAYFAVDVSRHGKRTRHYGQRKVAEQRTHRRCSRDERNGMESGPLGSPWTKKHDAGNRANCEASGRSIRSPALGSDLAPGWSLASRRFHECVLTTELSGRTRCRFAPERRATLFHGPLECVVRLHFRLHRQTYLR